MFDHSKVQVYAFEDIPLSRDITLMDERWMAEYEAALLKSIDEGGESAASIGYHAFATARTIGEEWVELSLYPNIFDRFHEVRISMPRSAFVTCVGSWEHDYKPVVFVRTDWFTTVFVRSYSIFGLIDAIGVKSALADGTLTRSKLISLRDRIDELAARHPTTAFISFADSLLIKSNYTVGYFEQGIECTVRVRRRPRNRQLMA